MMIEAKVLDDEGQKKYATLMNFNINNLPRTNEKKINAVVLRENFDSERSGRANTSKGPLTPIPLTPKTTLNLHVYSPSKFKTSSPKFGVKVGH